MSLIFKPIFGIVLNGTVLYFVTKLVTDIQYTGGIKFFIIGGIVLGLINTFIRPFIKVMSLPLIMISGGIVLVVWNIAILWFLSYMIGVIEFRDVTLLFPNVQSYVIGAIVFGVINWAAHLFD